MAKRKKTTKRHTTHRRRRMGSAGSAGIMHTVQEAIGVVIGSVAATVAQRSFKVNPKILAAVEVFGGVQIKNHAHSPLMAGIGWGVLSAGAIGFAHDFHIISGVEDFINGIDNDMSGGYEDQSYVQGGIGNEYYVNGFNNEQMVAGAAGGSYMG